MAFKKLNELDLQRFKVVSCVTRDIRLNPPNLLKFFFLYRYKIWVALALNNGFQEPKSEDISFSSLYHRVQRLVLARKGDDLIFDFFVGVEKCTKFWIGLCHANSMLRTYSKRTVFCYMSYTVRYVR